MGVVYDTFSTDDPPFIDGDTGLWQSTPEQLVELATIAAQFETRGLRYSEDQPRDEDGRFGSGGGAAVVQADIHTDLPIEDHRPAGEIPSTTAPGSGSLVGMSPGKDEHAVSLSDGHALVINNLNDYPESQVTGAKMPTAAQAQRMLSTIAYLHDHYPLTGYGGNPVQDIYLHVRDIDDHSTMASTDINQFNLQGREGTAHININADSSLLQPNPDVSGLMASADKDLLGYTVAHEYGHLLDVATNNRSLDVAMSDATVKILSSPGGSGGGLSKYGCHNDREAFAEAFADHVMSDGKSDNLATQAYAKAFGWK